jgi:hypothetical protein
MPGMLTHETHPPAPLRLSEGYVHDFRDAVSEGRFGPFNDYGEDDFDAAMMRPLPDLSDAATKGCLLALVREAHASLQSAECAGDGDPVNPWRWGAFRGATEEAALVAALEGAPCSGS